MGIEYLRNIKNEGRCAIKKFLDTLEEATRVKGITTEQRNLLQLLQDFETDLRYCEESSIKCPCPTRLNL
jgi:hypothetical protein